MKAGLLRPLRLDPAHSRGRRFPEPPHPYRSEFQRDRDRIVHARAFRRLENKTQVFTPGLSDHFRNRLTHTIEVSQISRTVAGTLGLEEDLTEALALGHDIGHPPFAHAGEAVLDELMRHYGERFDHNLHALRIVESFEQRYVNFPGLNLTFEVREGIVKHSRDFAPGEFPELEEYLPGLRPPLEAQLIDRADEIAYNTADLDDAYSAGLISFDQIASSVEQFRLFAGQLRERYPTCPERILFHEVLRRLIDWLVTGLIEGTLEAVQQAGVASVDEVRHYPARLARFSAATEPTNQQLKSFLHAHVYHCRALREERERSQQMIRQLFQLYVDQPGLMPEPYCSWAREQPVHRVVCDYIAGMTDTFFRRTYDRLFA